MPAGPLDQPSGQQWPDELAAPGGWCQLQQAVVAAYLQESAAPDCGVCHLVAVVSASKVYAEVTVRSHPANLAFECPEHALRSADRAHACLLFAEQSWS